MAQNAQTDGVIYPANVPGLKKAWAYMTGDAIESSPVIDGRMLYIGSRDHSLYAFDVYSGEKVWSYATGGSIPSTPTIANDFVFVGSNDHSLYAFNQIHTIRNNHEQHD